MDNKSQENYRNASDLKHKVENWVNREFNFIQLEVYEKMADNSLFEYIEPIEPDYGEFLNNYSLHDEFWQEYAENNDLNESELKEFQDGDEELYFEDLKEFCEDHQNFESFVNERENYPMWNTLFEVRSSWDKINEAAKNAGCGIITGLEPFNDTIFMTSAGHSFYSAYWIPIYLELFEDERKKYKNIDFSMV